MSSSKIVSFTTYWIDIPPIFVFFNIIFGLLLFNLIPNPSNSYSNLFFIVNGFVASKTNKIQSQVLATAITYLPLPLLSLAPSIIPGRSNN